MALRENHRPEWLRCQLTAVFEEDAHLGSGTGGLGIDALVARDRNGRPVIWASHLEGVLRDATLRQRGKPEAARLFGEGGRARQRLIFTSLYTTLERPHFRVWRSAARASYDNRAPKDDTLRAIEFVPQGTKFTGLVELPASDVAHLRDLLRYVEALGGGRAAGSGRISLAVAETKTRASHVSKVDSRLLLLLRNVDPVCITSTAVPTNLIPTFPFIPGRALLGSLADWLLGEQQNEAAAFLASGLVSVSDALPLPGRPPDLSKVEVSPVPLSLQSEKSTAAAGDTPWWALKATPVRWIDSHLARKENDGGGPKLKRPEPDRFVCRFGPETHWTAYRPQIHVRLRSGRPDPSAADASLFATEYIAEETLFLAEICGEPEHMQRLCNALLPVLEARRWLRIGRGGAPVEVAIAKPVSPSNPACSGTSAYLTLTSDLLVRDNRLRWLTSLDPKKLIDGMVPGWPEGLRATPIVQESTPVYGFNGTSRLWRRPAIAIRRGSVFEVDNSRIEDLAAAAANGRWLGERTHEGFGRFRLDAALPGASGDDVAPESTARLHTPLIEDELGENIAAETQHWLEDFKDLAQPARSTVARPSLSQWFDLISDLQSKAPDAFSSRKNPTTSGKRSWRNTSARAVLERLEELPRDQQVEYAHMFVRWIRPGLREREK